MKKSPKTPSIIIIDEKAEYGKSDLKKLSDSQCKTEFVQVFQDARKLPPEHSRSKIDKSNTDKLGSGQSEKIEQVSVAGKGRSYTRYQLFQRLLAQDGAYTVIGLMFMIGVFIPLFLVLHFSARVANTSSLANGVAYNMSYLAANRAVDVEATQNAGSVQLLQGSNLDIVERRADDALEAMNRASKLGLAGEPALQLDNADYINVGKLPSESYQGAGGACTPNAGILYQDEQGTTLCWQDERYREGNAEVQTGRDHFSSGTQMQIGFRVPFVQAPWGTLDSYHTGVSTFGRPCDPRLEGSGGEFCRY